MGKSSKILAFNMFYYRFMDTVDSRYRKADEAVLMYLEIVAVVVVVVVCSNHSLTVRNLVDHAKSLVAIEIDLIVVAVDIDASWVD